MQYEEKEITQTSNPTTQQHEYVQTETNYVPVVTEERGFSGATVAMIAMGAVITVALLFFLLVYNQQKEEYQNRQIETAQQQPIVIQQPAQPIVVQQPASQSAPVVISQPQSPNSTTSSEGNFAIDTAIQTEIDRIMKNDEEMSKVNITTTVNNGEIMLLGFVANNNIKKKAETMVKNIRGVKKIDNQLIVSNSGM